MISYWLSSEGQSLQRAVYNLEHNLLLNQKRNFGFLMEIAERILVDTVHTLWRWSISPIIKRQKDLHTHNRHLQVQRNGFVGG